ncbi:MAG: NERD domain-containing protein [Anaerolineaceae bacterium]|nr:NERD domain-containing protein [Anaerolineaceae bacterium]
MKHVIDQDKVNKYGLFSNIGSIAGLLILLGSVLLPVFVPGTSVLSAILMVVGLGVAMVGIFFANRWVRKPRPEVRLETVLKGLGEGYVLFHYPKLPADHILLSPAGVTTLETINISGAFSYLDGKWKESMTIGRAIRYIVEEHLGDPNRAALGSAAFVQEKLDQLEGLTHKVSVKPVVVFTHPAVKLEVKQSPVPVCMAEKLRKQVTAGPVKLPQEDYDKVYAYLESVTR